MEEVPQHKLPLRMEKNGVVKWYDNKPVLMMSAVHERQPEDTCQRLDKKLKRHVTIPRPNVINEYSSKMAGVDPVDRMMSYCESSLKEMDTADAHALYRSGFSQQLATVPAKIAMSVAHQNRTSCSFSNSRWTWQ